MSSRIQLILIDHFPRAIGLITEAMKKGETTTHDKPWKEMSVAEIDYHFEKHYAAFLEEDFTGRKTGEDDLLHCLCRGLMLLEKREKENRG